MYDNLNPMCIRSLSARRIQSWLGPNDNAGVSNQPIGCGICGHQQCEGGCDWLGDDQRTGESFTVSVHKSNPLQRSH